MPNFRSREFLTKHIIDTMAFYHPNCLDPAGGFFHFYRDDGSVYDSSTRHLVSSARFVFNYAMAYRKFKLDEYRKGVQHGIDYLRKAHYNPETGGYAWQLKDGKVDDGTNHCYGFSFLLLAYSKAIDAGIDEAKSYLEETWDVMEKHYWDPKYCLYKDEATADWKMSDYRGQNSNMHACEGMLAAYEATHEPRYLKRAALLADNMTNRQASLAGGIIWEHYKADWSIDWDYNKGDRSNIFRPWGFQPGHQIEWAKLLLTLDRIEPADWYLKRARELFDRAVELSWDDRHGGLVYGFDIEHKFYDEDKYFWVQSEALATAALLADRTGEDAYWQWYDKLWEYSWEHFVDHKYGAWYRILTPDNRKYSDEKSPAGKVDYHTMGACYEVLNIIPSEEAKS